MNWRFSLLPTALSSVQSWSRAQAENVPGEGEHLPQRDGDTYTRNHPPDRPQDPDRLQGGSAGSAASGGRRAPAPPPPRGALGRGPSSRHGPAGRAWSWTHGRGRARPLPAGSVRRRRHSLFPGRREMLAAVYLFTFGFVFWRFLRRRFHLHWASVGARWEPHPHLSGTCFAFLPPGLFSRSVQDSEKEHEKLCPVQKRSLILPTWVAQPCSWACLRNYFNGYAQLMGDVSLH